MGQKSKMSLLILSFFMFVSSLAVAQQKRVSGIVTDSNGEPIIGASVIANGTSAGSVTDIDGKFSFPVSNNAKALTVSYVGMKTVEVAISEQPLKIVLKENARSLEDVVVIGYGTAKKRDLTGSVTSIQGRDIANIPITSTAEAMAGRLAGVQVTTADGSPDAEILIRVRGGGSITGDNSPLYIIDGFPASNLSSISPTDIQSIDVLKDASSTAIYGSQGANGVIIITTKSAQGGKTQVSYNGFMQSKRLSKRLSVLNPYEYVMMNYELAALTSTDALSSFTTKFGVYDDLDLYKYAKGTDWQDDMFGSNVISQQQNISLNGGNEKTKFSLSSTYNYDGGLMESNNYNRFTTNFKLAHELSKNLKANFNVRLADVTVNGSGSSGANYKIRTYEAVTKPMVNGLSDQVTMDPSLMTEEEYDDWIANNMSLSDRAKQYWKRRKEKSFNFLGSIDWTITKGLVLRGEGGYEYGFRDDQNYWGETTTTASYVDGKPLVDWTNTNSAKLRFANTLTYTTKIQKNHSLNAMLGWEMNQSNSYNTYLYATGFGTDLTPDVIFANLALGGTTKNISSYVNIPINKLSFFGRANYAFKDRYLLAFTLRADGSSRFTKENRWGYFPAASAAWRMNEEPFMENSKSWLSNLKFRFSYGVAGNDGIPSGLTKSMYKINSTKTYGLGDIQNNYWASASSQLPNPNLKWETNYTNNLALDFGFLDEKINGTIEVYKNIAKDLLLTIPIVAPGYTTTTANIGQTSNQGMELTLNANLLNKKKINLNANFNIAFNHSNVDKLASGITVQEYASGWAGTDLKGYYDYHVEVGQPVGLMYGWVNDGYYTTEDFSEYNSATKTYVLKDGVPSCGFLGGRIGTRPGTAKFKDLNGDGVVNDNDRTIIGNAKPDFTGGFGLNGNIYDFDFSMLFSFVVGNDIYNANKIASAQQYRSTYGNLLGIMSQDNRYTYLNNETGTIVTDLATLASMNEGANAKEYWSPFSFGSATVMPMSWAIEDGSFLRFQNLTIGYTIPKVITSKFACDQFRVYCTLNNVLILTNYSGYDPEVSTPIRGSSTSGLTPGVDFSAYPKSFSWTVGLNVTF